MSTSATQTSQLEDTTAYPPDSEHLQPGADLVDYVKEYARQKPEVAALWCFGIGFIVGWKLKPW